MTTASARVRPDEPAPTAIPKLLAEHGGRIYALGVRLCGGEEEARDLVQETFLAAFRKWDQFEGRAEPSTWLYTIATRICRRRRRRRSGEPARIASLEELLPASDSIPDLASLQEGQLDTLLRQEAGEVVEAAVARLPLAFRMPLVLKDIAEFSVADVARILGLKEATVKTRVHRARLFLRRELLEVLPRRPAGPREHSRSLCLDLLRGKQEALDRGVEFPLAPEELCSRCQAVFATLDLAREVCEPLGRGELPPDLAAELLGDLAAHTAGTGRPRASHEPA